MLLLQLMMSQRGHGPRSQGRPLPWQLQRSLQWLSPPTGDVDEETGALGQELEAVLAMGLRGPFQNENLPTPWSGGVLPPYVTSPLVAPEGQHLGVVGSRRRI